MVKDRRQTIDSTRQLRKKRAQDSDESHNDDEQHNECTNSQAPRNISPHEEDVLITAILKYYDIIEQKCTDKSLGPHARLKQVADAWKNVRLELLQRVNANRSVETLKNKWKNIKAAARRRNQLIRKSQLKTGGGTLTDTEKRIVESPLYSDIGTRLGVSAVGNEPRFDSDSTSASANIEPPTSRLRNVLNTSNATSSSNMNIDENAQASFDSIQVNESDDSLGSNFIGNFMNLNASTSTSQNILTSQNVLTSQGSSISHQTESQIPEAHFAQPSPTTSQLSGRDRSSSTSEENTPTKRPRTTTKNVQLNNSMQFSLHLRQQQENNLLQKQYIQLQIDRAMVAKDREILQKRLVELEVEKAEELKQIEIDKQKKLADLEIAAKRKEYGLP